MLSNIRIKLNASKQPPTPVKRPQYHDPSTKRISFIDYRKMYT